MGRFFGGSTIIFRCGLAMIAAVLFAVNGGGHNVHAADKVERTLMVFTAEVDGQWDLYSWVPFSKHSPKQLTNTPIDEMRPSLSWDRRYVAYEDSAGHIKGMALEGRDTFTVTTPEQRDYFLHPSISPDGSVLLSVLRYDPSEDVTDLAVRPAWCHTVGEGPDHSTVVFGSSWDQYAKWKDEIWILDMLSSQYSPCWAPDGKRLAFVNLHDRGTAGGRTIGEIWETRIDHSYARQLTLMDALCADPAWSPKGDTVALACDKFGQFDIFVVDPTSRSISRETKDPAADTDPVFSPDGRYIVFVSTRSGLPSLWILDIEGDSLMEAHPFREERVPIKDPDWR
jgi:Tol biopolymer transport system component